MNYINQPQNNQRVCEGDICVIYISEQNKNILKIQPDAQLQTKFGMIKAMDLLNHPYGVRFECKKGWIMPLRLTPEFWTQILPHRTQILYQADISMILLKLDIKPGSIVVESGTGSGSLSHAILRACLPDGYLYTFDINESRVNDAQKEFDDHGLGDNVKVMHRNVCELGFLDELEGKVDACVLDLPQTWGAIEHAYKILKKDGSRICTFSPCIEQVKQNVAKMTDLKFKDIITVECILRPLEVRTQKMRLWDIDILQGLAAIDKVRIENLKKYKRNPSKRPKLDQDPKVDDNLEADASEHESVRDLNTLDKALTDPKVPFTPNMLPSKSFVHAKQLNETVSHSGYLTFASKRP